MERQAVSKWRQQLIQWRGRLNKLVKWRGRLSPMETAVETGICLTHTPSPSVGPSVGMGISLTHTPSPSVGLSHIPKSVCRPHTHTKSVCLPLTHTKSVVGLTHTPSPSVSPSVDMGICLTHLPSQSSVGMGICLTHT